MDLGPWVYSKPHIQMGSSIHIPKHIFFPPRAVHAVDSGILSSKYGLQHQAHRPQDPVLPSGVVQTPMVGDVEPVRLHPGLVLHDKVGAIDSTTQVSCRHAFPAADPNASQAGSQGQEQDLRHEDPRPRTKSSDGAALGEYGAALGEDGPSLPSQQQLLLQPF